MHEARQRSSGSFNKLSEAKLSSRMEKAIFVAQHRLSELDLFSDENLIKLIDSHPQAALGINTMGTDSLLREQW